MNHCVPEWDVTGRDLDVVMDTTDTFLREGKGEAAQQRRSNVSDMAFVPDREFEELCWENDQLLVVMQGQNSKGHKQRLWPVNTSSQFPAILESNETAFLCSSQAPEKDGTLEAVVGDAGACRISSAGNRFQQEDEMLAWLQYPSDEPLPEFCSELFVNQNVQQRKVYEGQVAVESGQPGARSSGQASFQAIPGNIQRDVASNIANGNLAGRVPSARVGAPTTQPTQQATCMMGSAVQTVATSKQSNGFYSKASNSDSAHSPSSKGAPGRGSMMARSHMPPPKVVVGDGPSQIGRSGLMNFSHFSMPAAAIKADLHNLGMASRPTVIDRLKQLDRMAVEVCKSTDSFIGSTAAGATPLQVEGDGNTLLAAVDGPHSMGTSSAWHSVQSVSSRTAADCSVKSVDLSNGWNSCVTSNPASETEKAGKVLQAPVATVTVSTGGSGNSGGKNEKAGVCEKRKARDEEDSECHCEGPEDESSDVKKYPAGRSTATKRSRAALIHNQSERRRRDKINEKMKALQALVPNSNKTDKASLLEDAIDYLKRLQTQLQVMCFGSGMGIAPLLIPAGMQQLQMAQMATLPHMGMRMGMLDMGFPSSANHAIQLQSMPGPVLPGSPVPAVPFGMLPANVASAPPVLGTKLSGPCIPKPPHHAFAHSLVAAVSNCPNQLQASDTVDFKRHASPHQMQMSFQPQNMNVHNTLAVQKHCSQQQNRTLGGAPTE